MMWPYSTLSAIDDLIANPELKRVVYDVFADAYGVGRERKYRLTEAGYNYNVVQAAVNMVYYYMEEELKNGQTGKTHILDWMG